jgi:hypothetical protein
MTYELTKQLKDAEFYPTHAACMKCELDAERDEVVHYPTLSELIEACGDKFYALWRSRDEWRASEKIGVLGDQDHEFGCTPEEAVAKLWLALHASTSTAKTLS